ncbi:hypothetical protein EV179_004245 [Coemansia sp. RSA 487]|nr:hypothetical protein LPJ74_004047 [Coemansia sp. RSA 1843]KAJ2212934.1 hypothetical protein EV179_004245 [Coemansia sp. RSA 487]
MHVYNCFFLTVAAVAVSADMQNQCHLYRRQNTGTFPGVQQQDAAPSPVANIGNDGGSPANSMGNFDNGMQIPSQNGAIASPTSDGTIPQQGNGIMPQQGNGMVPQQGNGMMPQQGNGMTPHQTGAPETAAQPEQQQQQQQHQTGSAEPTASGSDTQTQSIPSTIFDDLPGFLGITFPGQAQPSASAGVAGSTPTGSDTPSDNVATDNARDNTDPLNNSAKTMATSNATATHLNALLAIMLALVTAFM